MIIDVDHNTVGQNQRHRRTEGTTKYAVFLAQEIGHHEITNRHNEISNGTEFMTIERTLDLQTDILNLRNARREHQQQQHAIR